MTDPSALRAAEPGTRVVRATRQRAAVSALLDRVSDFRSAQEIHEELRRTGEGIGLTTVYRTLQTLADSGEVDVLRTASGEALYRRCDSADHHHHLVCRRCGRAVEIEGPAVETHTRNYGYRAERFGDARRRHRGGRRHRGYERQHSRAQHGA